jgi:aspartate aminotransferase-like enzyme
MNPLRELTAIAREQQDLLVMVDAVTSFAGAPIDCDELGLDLVFASTQKCLALPPGFTVYAVSRRALERAATVPHRGWLLDFVRAFEGLEKGETPATPSLPHLFALDLQLERIAAEGIEVRYARHRQMAERCRAWARGRGMQMFGAPEHLSPTVSTIAAGKLDVAALTSKLKAQGFAISNGYGKLKGSTFRIGHMGDHRLEGLERLLQTIDRVLA